jgi:hypothetical protein
MKLIDNLWTANLTSKSGSQIFAFMKLGGGSSLHDFVFSVPKFHVLQDCCTVTVYLK